MCSKTVFPMVRSKNFSSQTESYGSINGQVYPRSSCRARANIVCSICITIYLFRVLWSDLNITDTPQSVRASL